MTETDQAAEAEAEKQEATAVEESQANEPVAEAEEVEKPKTDELKVVIIVRDKKMMIGVQSPDCDPMYETLEGTLPTALKRIPKLVAEAKQKWDAHPRYPKADLPTPEPAKTPARTPAAPKEKKQTGQPSFF